jgi:hypothetical protein
MFTLGECRPGQRIYGLTIVGGEGHSVLDMALERIEFEGVRHPVQSGGDILVKGWGIDKPTIMLKRDGAAQAVTDDAKYGE